MHTCKILDRFNLISSPQHCGIVGPFEQTFEEYPFDRANVCSKLMRRLYERACKAINGTNTKMLAFITGKTVAEEEVTPTNAFNLLLWTVDPIQTTPVVRAYTENG